MNMPAYDSTPDSLAHIRRVQELLADMQARLAWRAIEHDRSKLEEPEKSMFDEVTLALRGLTYGSDEYKAQLAAMGPALAHHYAHNSHHPEHYPDGVAGMTLLDLVEMLCDWKAAGERHSAGGGILKSLEINRERFNISDQPYSILLNTVREMGW